MEIKEAIDILEKHNRWRLGADIPMAHPKDITNAINTVIENYRKRYKQITYKTEKNLF